MRSDRLPTVIYAGFVLSVCLTLLVVGGCAFDPCNPGHGIHACNGATDTASSTDDQGGGDGATLQLPFAEGTSWRCTQGANGSYSHSSNSTTYGIDLDTPNGSAVEIYAPVSGVARVHEESATSNFGYAVNIDVGDGTYVVIAHNSEIFVTDGQEVSAGTLIAYDGCTGACSGDHTHVGLMEGDAGEMAQYGTSVGTGFYARDANDASSAFGDIDATAFVCGTTDGHLYESALPVPMWHPNGTLVKVPDSPNVYLVEGGKARHVADETTFWSHNLSFDDLSIISDEELSCLGLGDEISSSGSVGAAYDSEENAWLTVTDTGGSSWKQKIQSDGRNDVLASWGLSGSDLADAEALSASEQARYATRAGTAPFRDGTILKESGRSDVYVVSDGVALPVKDWDAYLLMGFANRSILTVPDGEVSSVMGNDGVGSCSAGVWCLDAEAVTSCGGGLDVGSGSEAGGEELDTGGSTETEESEEERSEDEEAGVEDDTETTDATPSSTDYVYVSDPYLCLSSAGFRAPYDNADAYAVGYGEGLDWTLRTSMIAGPDDVAFGYVCLDTSSWAYDSYEITLVSSLKADGSSATSYADTGDWWDNYDFCVGGTDIASDFCASQGGYDYLIGFTKSMSGLFPSGDGA